MEIVHPNTAEVETIVLMMNKQVAAYLIYYLVGKGLNEGFIRELVAASCDVVLVEEISRCQLDLKMMMLTIPADKEEIYSLG